MPSAYMESFHSKCCGVSNANVNGTSYFMEPAVKLFTEDSVKFMCPHLFMKNSHLEPLITKQWAVIALMINVIFTKTITNHRSNAAHSVGIN